VKSRNLYISTSLFACHFSRTAFSISLKLRRQPIGEGAKEVVPMGGEEEDEQRGGNEKANAAAEAEESESEPRRVGSGENETFKKEWQRNLGHANSGLEHSFARIECQVVSGNAQASACSFPLGQSYHFPSLFF
jgi:hypothetical protein